MVTVRFRRAGEEEKETVYLSDRKFAFSGSKDVQILSDGRK